MRARFVSGGGTAVNFGDLGRTGGTCTSFGTVIKISTHAMSTFRGFCRNGGGRFILCGAGRARRVFVGTGRRFGGGRFVRSRVPSLYSINGVVDMGNFSELLSTRGHLVSRNMGREICVLNVNRGRTRLHGTVSRCKIGSDFVLLNCRSGPCGCISGYSLCIYSSCHRNFSATIARTLVINATIIDASYSNTGRLLNTGGRCNVIIRGDRSNVCGKVGRVLAGPRLLGGCGGRTGVHNRCFDERGAIGTIRRVFRGLL